MKFIKRYYLKKGQKDFIKKVRDIFAESKENYIDVIEIYTGNTKNKELQIKAEKITDTITVWSFSGRNTEAVQKTLALADLKIKYQLLNGMYLYRKEPEKEIKTQGVEKEKAAGVTGSDYKELIQIITEARESVLDGVELAAENSDIMETLRESVKLLECGLNMARDIYVAYLENENKKLFESAVNVGAAGRGVPDPAGGCTVPA